MTLVGLLLVFMLTVGRAYQTETMSFGFRFLLWTIVVGLILAQVFIIRALLLNVVPRRLHNPVTKLGFVALALLGTALLLGLELSWLKATPLLPKEPDPYWDFVGFLVLPVLFLGGIALLIDYLMAKIIRSHAQSSGVSNDDTSIVIDKKFLGSKWSQNEILLVQAQEHYLSVHSEKGSALIKGRMSDAVKILGNSEGVQTHRSWWVALSHVESISRKGRDVHLKTKDGLIVPVSRARLENVKASLKTQGIII